MPYARWWLLGILAILACSGSSDAGWLFGGRGGCESRVVTLCPTTCVPLCRQGPVVMVSPPILVFPQAVNLVAIDPVSALTPAPTTATVPASLLPSLRPSSYEWTPSTYQYGRYSKGSPVAYFAPEVANPYPTFGAGFAGGALGGSSGSNGTASTMPSSLVVPLFDFTEALDKGSPLRFLGSVSPTLGDPTGSILRSPSNLLAEPSMIHDFIGPGREVTPTIAPVPTAAVPEPPAMVSTLVGLLAMAGVRAWRR